jgi:hypothetical protein
MPDTISVLKSMDVVEKLYTIPAGEVTKDAEIVDADTGVIRYNDEASVKLVIDDTERCDTFLNQNQWAAGWTLADMLYQSPASQSAFDNNVGDACVPKYMVSNHLSAIVPKVMGGIFYEDPPFLLRPRPGTTSEIIEAKTAIFAAQLGAMRFEEEVERTIDQAALLGTGIMKWGYQEYDKKMKRRVRTGKKFTVKQADGSAREYDSPESDDFKIEFYDKKISHPWIKFCDIRTVLMNPGCRVGDARKSGWLVYRDYGTYADINRLRDIDGYEIPSEEILRQVFAQGLKTGTDNITMTLPEGMKGYLQHAMPRAYKTSSDPLAQPIEILERWDEEKVIVVLACNGHNILIRNEANPYGKIPFYSFNWRNIPDCFYGQGLGLLIGSEQVVEQGITNLALSLLAYGLQPTAVRKKGFNVPTQTVKWRQGGIIDVEEDVDKAFKFLEMPGVPSEAWAFLQQAQTSGASTSGANEQVVQGAGAMGARSTGMRSGTGAAAVIQANASRLDGPTSRFVRQVFEPWLYQMDELDNDLLPAKVLRDLLGEELGKPYLVDHMDYREAKIEYEVLAGAKLGAKKEMSQFLPIMVQFTNNPTFTKNVTDAGYMWDGVAIFNEFAHAAGWKYSQSFLRKMTPEELKARDANSPAVMQARTAQSKQAQQLAQFQHEEQMQDMKTQGEAANRSMRIALENSMEPELTTGEPGNRGEFSETAL